MPRYSLAVVCTVHALVFGAAAVVLPWNHASAGTVVLALVALSHAVTAALALSRREAWLKQAWHVLSLVSLGFLLIASWVVLGTAIYLLQLYLSIGQPLAGLLLSIWILIVALTLPISAWGLAHTFAGSRLSRLKRKKPVVVASSVLFALSLLLLERSANATPAPKADPQGLLGILRELRSSRFGGEPGKRISLFTLQPVKCGQPLDSDALTVLVTYSDKKKRSPRSECLQTGTLSEMKAKLLASAATADESSNFKIDLVTSTQRLTGVFELLDSFKFRPGIDGACAKQKCLAPWQLIAADLHSNPDAPGWFNQSQFGFWIGSLLAALKSDATSAGELTRIETKSYVVDPSGVTELVGFSPKERAPTRENLAAAERAAERHIVEAQLDDGKFRYLVDPFTGKTDSEAFGLPRQAGTTYAICSLGEGKATDKAIRRSLEFMSGFEKKSGKLSLLGKADDKAGVGETALPLIAFLECRGRVNDTYDGLIGRLGQFLLMMQRPDGSFYPSFDLASHEPRGTHEALYASGQAVLALVLLEQLERITQHPDFPTRNATHAALERAMDFYANHYWTAPARDFFLVEENWHCLAARAALTSHRSPSYEKFCIDYVAFKSRLIQRRINGADAYSSGGLSFVRIVPPAYTPTAGFGEAMAAAMAVKRANHLDMTSDVELMREVLGFLLRAQWQDSGCFACTTRQRIPGAFSNYIADPTIRIDFVQHAMSALGHGAAQIASN